MDELLNLGLKHIDAAYSLASKLIESKLAPHRIGMACFTYDRDDMYVVIGKCGTSVMVYAKYEGTGFHPYQADAIVTLCQKLGFTPGSVTQDQLAKHRKIVEKAWEEMCKSLSTLKADFAYDDVSFLWLYFNAEPRRNVWLCTDRNDGDRVLVHTDTRHPNCLDEPRKAAALLQSLYNLRLKEEGE